MTSSQKSERWHTREILAMTGIRAPSGPYDLTRLKATSSSKEEHILQERLLRLSHKADILK